MANYKIQINNHSGGECSYYLAFDTPSVSGLSSDTILWSTVLVSRTVQTNNIAIMNVPAIPATSSINSATSSDPNCYVICGSSPDTPLTASLSVEISGAAPFTSPGGTGPSSASQNFSVTTQDDEVNISNAQTVSNPSNAWCVIQTQAFSYSPAMYAFTGLAIEKTGSEEISPTCIWAIHPSSSYTINAAPPPSFKLGIGTNTPGTLVNLQDPGNQFMPVNFTGAASKLCNVTHNSTGLLIVRPIVR